MAQAAWGGESCCCDGRLERALKIRGVLTQKKFGHVSRERLACFYVPRATDGCVIRLSRARCRVQVVNVAPQVRKNGKILEVELWNCLWFDFDIRIVLDIVCCDDIRRVEL